MCIRDRFRAVVVACLSLSLEILGSDKGSIFCCSLASLFEFLLGLFVTLFGRFCSNVFANLILFNVISSEDALELHDSSSTTIFFLKECLRFTVMESSLLLSFTDTKLSLGLYLSLSSVLSSSFVSLGDKIVLTFFPILSVPFSILSGDSFVVASVLADTIERERESKDTFWVFWEIVPFSAARCPLLRPVSYTHLDVYKRQLLRFTIG